MGSNPERAAARRAGTLNRGQITDRLLQAGNLIGHDAPQVRIAGIHALWHIAEDAPDDAYLTVLDILCAALCSLSRNANDGNSPDDEVDPQDAVGVYRTVDPTKPSKYFKRPMPVAKPPDDIRAIAALLRNRHAVEAFARLETLAGVSLDLIGARLRRVDLSGADLRGADLSGTDLRDADLRRADLTGANLTEARLRDADLTDADLTDAILRRTEIKGAKLYCYDEEGEYAVNLRGTDFVETDLQTANFAHLDLQGASFADANLQYVDFRGSNLEGARFRDVWMKGAQLWESNLKEVHFYRVDMTDADLRGADLRGALLSAGLAGANFLRADLRDAILAAGDLRGAWFCDADLRGTDLSDTDMSGTKDLTNEQVQSAYYWSGRDPPKRPVVSQFENDLG